uniref:Uncharacterized protein n=1 Tax=viral metagenome TaxID=1070528 RepID=A0A6C0F6R8_9ZZZZ
MESMSQPYEGTSQGEYDKDFFDTRLPTSKKERTKKKERGKPRGKHKSQGKHKSRGKKKNQTRTQSRTRRGSRVKYNKDKELENYDSAVEPLMPLIEDKEVNEEPRTGTRINRRPKSQNVDNLEAELEREAAQKIQSVTRGIQTRKKHPPRTRSMDDELITRITNRNMLGRDVNTIRDKMEGIESIRDTYLFSGFDKSKYRYGKKYFFPEREHGLYSNKRGHPIIIAKNKNREALLDIHRRSEKLLRESKMKLGKEDEIRPYPPPEQIEEELIEEYIPEYLYVVNMPEDEKMKAKAEWEETVLQVLYEGEEIPELVPLTEEDIKPWRDGTWEKENEYIHSPETVKELKEHYRKYHDAYVTAARPDALLETGEKIKDVYQKQLRYYDGQTIMGCTKMKKQTDVNPKLFNDRNYLNQMIKPCKDNKLLTEVYINNFDNIPSQFIVSQNIDIRDHLLSVSRETSMVQGTRKTYISKYFPKCIIKGILHGLENLGLYQSGRMDWRSVNQLHERTTIGIHRNAARSPHERYSSVHFLIKPTNSFYMIAMMFKEMDTDVPKYLEVGKQLTVTHKEWQTESGMYIPKSSIKGIDALKLFLDNLELYYKEEKEKYELGDKYNPEYEDIDFDTYDIEKTKRIFILMLMGLVGGDEQGENVSIQKITQLRERIREGSSSSYTTIYKHYKGLPKVEDYDEKLKKNTGKPVKKMVKTDVLAGHLNMLDMYGWYTDLIDEYEELFVYFLNKLKLKAWRGRPSQRVRTATVDGVFREPFPYGY